VPRTRPPYPPEFRREAIELVRSSGEPIGQIAKDLGCTEQTLRNRVKQAEVDLGRRPGVRSDEREELTQLRRENRVLRQEREVLRKAAAFFARESETR